MKLPSRGVSCCLTSSLASGRASPSSGVAGPRLQSADFLCCHQGLCPCFTESPRALSLAKVLQGQCKRGAVGVLTVFLFLGSQAVFPHDSASEVSQTGMRPHPDDAGPVCATSDPTMPITQQSNHADQPTGDLTMQITKQNNHANQQSTVPINQQSSRADQPTGDLTCQRPVPLDSPGGTATEEATAG